MIDYDSKQTIEHFKSLPARAQRKWIADTYLTLTVERMDHIIHWAQEYAPDLIEESAYAVVAFDVWWIVTRVYDVDLPNDVAEIIAEDALAGRGQKAAQPWRNLLVRQDLPWRKFTREDLIELGVQGLS